MGGFESDISTACITFASNVFFCAIFILFYSFFFFAFSIAFYAVDNTPEPKCHYHSLHQFSLC